MISEILSHLPARYSWRETLHWFDSIESTNTRAKQLALEGAPHGTVLIAGHQAGGRGRMGRSFHSPQNMGIYLSVILRYPLPPDRLMHLTCAAAVAMCNAVEQAAGIRPQIKWINDLICQSRKLAGILTELVILPQETCAVIGIGINCCQQEEDLPQEIRQIATSLRLCTGAPVDRAKVAAAMLQALHQMDADLFVKKAELMANYAENCITLGKDIQLIRADEIRYGHAEDLDADGGLIVRFSDGHTEVIQSGEASIRGMYGYLA